MKAINPSHLLRYLSILGPIPFLFNSLTHGPGRGMSLAPAGETALGLLIPATYTLIIAGALTLRLAPRRGAMLLLLGVLLRCLLESRISLLGEWWFKLRHSSDAALWAAVFALSYFLNFIAPALLLLDSKHLLWKRAAREKP